MLKTAAECVIVNTEATATDVVIEAEEGYTANEYAELTLASAVFAPVLTTFTPVTGETVVLATESTPTATVVAEARTCPRYQAAPLTDGVPLEVRVAVITL
tara:strand:+ start:73 stop:375 length:303 start_codon:yes stop_codon:yes gene_type:complete